MDLGTDPAPAPSANSTTGRFLFVVPPLAGHANPTVTLGRTLIERGHTVAWTGHTDPVADLLPAGATFLPAADALPPAVAAAIAHHTTRGTRGVTAFKSSWEEFVVPVARQMLPGVHAAVERFAPDVLIVDQQALAGAAVAELRRLPWATSATTSAELVDPLATLPKVRDWLRDLITRVLVDAGLDPDHARRLDPRFSPHLVLAFTTPQLIGRNDDIPPHWALVGPSIRDRFDETPFPWDWLDAPGPHVLVSLGTLNWRGGARFFATAAHAIAGLNLRGIVVAPPELVPNPPGNVLIRPRIPQLAVLPRIDAVVSHGGHNTVCESLSCGVPLVVAPIRDDQPIIADQVVRAGAGLRVMFSRVTAPALQDALTEVLQRPRYRAAAGKVRASFAAAGGAVEAADQLDALLRSPVPPPGPDRPQELDRAGN